MERDIKTATQLIRIFVNLFAGISTLNISDPLMVTLGFVEKAVCSIQKSIDTIVDNKEFEEVVNDTLGVLIVFKDEMVKGRTMFNQEQWSKKPIVNLITDTITKSEV